MEMRTREQNDELAVRLAGRDIRCLRLTDARDCVAKVMNGPGTGVVGILVRRDGMMGKLQEDLAILIRACLRAACEKLINFSMDDSTAASFGASATPGTGSLPTCEVVPTLGETLMDLDIVTSESVPPPAEVSDASDIEKTVADLIGDVRSSSASASQAVDASYSVGRHDN